MVDLEVQGNNIKQEVHKLLNKYLYCTNTENTRYQMKLELESLLKKYQDKFEPNVKVSYDEDETKEWFKSIGLL